MTTTTTNNNTYNEVSHYFLSAMRLPYKYKNISAK